MIYYAVFWEEQSAMKNRVNAEPNFKEPGVGIQQRYKENKRSNKNPQH